MFRQWFTFSLLGGSDLPYFTPDRLKELDIFPQAWGSTFGDGLGESLIKYLWVETYLRLVVGLFVNRLGLDWEFVQRLFWFWPSIILLFLSPLLLISYLLKKQKNPLFLLPGVIVFSLNTYVLMLGSGGQINLLLSYALSPLVLICFIRLFNPNVSKNYLRDFIIAGILLGFQTMMDLRLAYVTMIAVGGYFIFNFKLTYKYLMSLIVPLLITALLHAFWLLPQFVVKSSPFPPGYDNPGWLSFLSWARLSETIAPLHPNWPENIFGKTYLMRPEFLVIPIIAYSSLFFIKKNINIIFFVLLGLIGTFLSKGVNPPFGETYEWLNKNIPGFVMFRDPTKFYLLTILSYTLLIPHTLINITKNKNIPVFMFIIYSVLLIMPFISGDVKGTFSVRTKPIEYDKLDRFLASERSFSRSLWIPQTHRLAYSTDVHPVVPATKYFNKTDVDQIILNLKRPDVIDKLRLQSIKYVIIPYDNEGQIFLTERIYDESFRKKTEEEMDQNKYLTKLPQFMGKLTVYKIEGVKNHFYFLNSGNNPDIYSQKIRPTEFFLKSDIPVSGGLLVFSEKFDIGWNLVLPDGNKIQSFNRGGINSFDLRGNSFTTGKLIYEPQKFVAIGVYISLSTLVLCLSVLIGLNIKNILWQVLRARAI